MSSKQCQHTQDHNSDRQYRHADEDGQHARRIGCQRRQRHAEQRRQEPTGTQRTAHAGPGGLHGMVVHQAGPSRRTW
ncbi:hypothetical protein DBR34_04835 [Stenotrophomonas sp. HMWF003]|nr:hypothetical protein DBR34_04835 [Stenotrophomonas sp. HMWF003]